MNIETYAKPEDRETPSIFVARIWREYGELDATGKPKETDWAEFRKRGDANWSIPIKVGHALKDAVMKSVLEPAYARWKTGQEDPVDGTPLAAWPGCTPPEADRLKSMNVRTVEDVAAMTDADAGRFGMGANQLIGKAKRFVANKPGAQHAQEVAAMKEANESLQYQLLEMQEAIKAMQAQKPVEATPSRRKEAA